MADNSNPTPCDDEDYQQGLTLLSQDLERRLIVTKKEVDGIIVEVDSERCSIEQYNEFVSTIHASRADLLSARLRLENFIGTPVEDSIKMNLGHYEHASVNLLADINNRLSIMRSEPQLEPRDPEIHSESLTENASHTYTAQNQTATTTSARPIAEQTDQCTDIDVRSEVSAATEGLTIGQTAYGTQLAAVVPRKIARKSRSKTSKQSSASSTAMKLKLRTEEAELTINQQFDEEMTDRAQRQLSRNAKKERDRLAAEARREAEKGEKQKGGREKQKGGMRRLGWRKRDRPIYWQTRLVRGQRPLTGRGPL